MAPTSLSFNTEYWYRPTDPAMSLIGTPSTLAHWRCEGRGPKFSKIGKGQGSRILYSGIVLVAWLESQAVPITAVPGSAA